MKYIRLIRMDNGQDFIPSAQLINNADGSVSFLLPNGGFAGQEPGLYGARHDQHDGSSVPQQYQRATLVGSVVTFVPLTPGQDRSGTDMFLPMGYLAYIGQVFG